MERKHVNNLPVSENAKTKQDLCHAGRCAAASAQVRPFFMRAAALRPVRQAKLLLAGAMRCIR